MPISMTSRKMSAHRMIARWGGRGQLIRAGTARDCTMAIMDWSWQERQTIAADNSVKIRLSVIPADPNVDELLDYISFKGGFYKINKKPYGPRPRNEAVFIDCDCLAISADSIS